MASDGASDETGLPWALASEHRLRIFCPLEQGERSVSDLAAQAQRPKGGAAKVYFGWFADIGVQNR
jgi:hypothetical protein